MSKSGTNSHRAARKSCAALGVLTLVFCIGCGDDDGGDDRRSPDGGTPDAMIDAALVPDSTAPAPQPDGGAPPLTGMDSGATPAPQRWIVGGWITTQDSYTGYLTVVRDLSSAGRIDLTQVVEFPGDMTYETAGDGVVFVGLEDKPVLERWVLGTDDKLTKDGEISFATRNVTSTLGGGRNLIQLIGPERAYYFDNENLQVIVFNPTRLEILSSFSLAGLEESGQELALNFVHKDGNRFIITGRYWSLADETSTSLVRAAIIDSTNDSVTYVEDRRCGNIAFHITDQAGNVYYGSHAGLAVSIAAGTAGANPPTPCLLRINKGASQFDPTYFVDMADASGGVVGGLLQGSDGNAYVFQYAGPGITADNERATLRGENWTLASFKLGSEKSTFARVNGVGALTAYGDSFTTNVQGKLTPFVVGVKADFSEGRYYDVSDPSNVKPALSFPSYPGHAHAAR
jgi:hypothetical protein